MRNEIKILSNLLVHGVPAVIVVHLLIMDNRVVVGYRMKTLHKLEMLEFRSRSSDIQNALRQLLKAGFCHGDFRPSNVMKHMRIVMGASL